MRRHTEVSVWSWSKGARGGESTFETWRVTAAERIDKLTTEQRPARARCPEEDHRVPIGLERGSEGAQSVVFASGAPAPPREFAQERGAAHGCRVIL